MVAIRFSELLFLLVAVAVRVRLLIPLVLVAPVVVLVVRLRKRVALVLLGKVSPVAILIIPSQISALVVAVAQAL